MNTSKSILLVVCMVFGAHAFGQSFDKGTKVASLGIGIGSSLGSFDYSSQVPALSVMYEQGIAEAGNVGIIGVGGYIGYKSFSYETSSASFSSKSKWNYTIVGIRGALHFTGVNVENLDLYAGLMASYNILNYSYEDNTGLNTGSSGNYSNSAGITVYGGARYYFTDQLAVFGEVGYGISYLNLGLALKF